MRRQRGAAALLAPALALLALPPGVWAQDRPHPTVDDLGFMAGCWRGEFGDAGVIEEVYMRPAGGLMLGLTRFLRSGRAVQYEFARIDGGEGSDEAREWVMRPVPCR